MMITFSLSVHEDSPSALSFHQIHFDEQIYSNSYTFRIIVVIPFNLRHPFKRHRNNLPNPGSLQYIDVPYPAE